MKKINIIYIFIAAILYRYENNSVNSVYQIYELKTVKLLSTWNVPEAGQAGAGIGPATYYEGVLYISTGPSVFAVDPKDGKLIYRSNSWDWVALANIRSKHKL